MCGQSAGGVTFAEAAFKGACGLILLASTIDGRCARGWTAVHVPAHTRTPRAVMARGWFGAMLQHAMHACMHAHARCTRIARMHTTPCARDSHMCSTHTCHTCRTCHTCHTVRYALGKLSSLEDYGR
jgi:hypothetical protein